MVDSSFHNVQKFDINGHCLLQFGKPGSGDGGLYNPQGIMICNDRVFVADHYNNYISVFQCDGQFSHNIGSGQLRSPSNVTVNNNNQLLVTDKSECISIFTLNGNYVGKIDVQDSQDWVSGPLVVDKRGFIIV